MSQKVSPSREVKRPKSKAQLSAESELRTIRLRYPTGSPAREQLIKECRERYKRRGIIV